LETSPWFSLSKISGTTPDDVGVSVALGGITTGQYLDSIRITSSNPSVVNTEWVFVQLSITACPQLVVSKSVFDVNAYAGVPMTFGDSVRITSTGADGRHGAYSAFVMLGIDGNNMLYAGADLARRFDESPIVVNAIAAYFLFGEAVTLTRWLGIGFIVIGVWLVARS
jgi:hypothetical protein